MKPIFLFLLSLFCFFSEHTFAQEITGSESTYEQDSVEVEMLLKASGKYYNEVQSNYETDTLLDQALLLAHKANYIEGQIKAYYTLGWRNRNKGDYKKAFEYLNLGLVLAEKHNLDYHILSNLNALATTSRRIDENSRAVEYSLRALPIAEKLDNSKGISIALNNIGNANMALGNMNEAEKAFRQALAIAHNTNNLIGEAVNNNNLGRLFERTNKYDSALVHYENALELDLQKNYKIGIAISYNSLGDIHFLKNEIRKAEDYYKKALALNLEMGDKRYIAINYIDLGKAYLELNNIEQAKVNLVKGLNLAKSISSKNQVQIALDLLAKLYEQNDNYKLAYAYTRESQVYADSLQRENKQKEIARLQTLYNEEKKDRTIENLTKEKELQALKLRDNRILIGLLAGAFLLAGLGWYFNAKQRKLKAQKRLSELEKQMVVSQMNPHFLFNSLNSIKSFIVSNDSKRASFYLNKFARLVRYTLDSAEKPHVSLQEELNFVEDYIKVERLRLNNAFVYNIKVDEDINPSNLKIPTLIFQPFVENAIWHGLSHKEDQGILNVEVSRNKNDVIVRIEDNGVGRKRSAEMHGEGKSTALGIKMTKERLELIGMEGKGEERILIHDKHDDNGRATGTVVEIKLPYQKFVA